MKGFRRVVLRVSMIIPLIAFLIFALSAMQASANGFVTTQPVVIEKKAVPASSSYDIWYTISALLVIIGFAGYLQKKESRR